MVKQDFECRCIRCREIGHHTLNQTIDLSTLDISLVKHKYTASNADEIFLSLEDKKQDVIVGYLRLRDIVQPHRQELLQQPCMIIREVKILGRELALGKRSSDDFQHKGYGKELISEAMRICHEEYDKKQLFVLSGVGVKQYYRKQGFSDHGVYLSVSLE